MDSPKMKANNLAVAYSVKRRNKMKAPSCSECMSAGGKCMAHGGKVEGTSMLDKAPMTNGETSGSPTEDKAARANVIQDSLVDTILKKRNPEMMASGGEVGSSTAENDFEPEPDFSTHPSEESEPWFEDLHDDTEDPADESLVGQILKKRRGK